MNSILDAEGKDKEIVDQAEELLVKLKHMEILKKAIAQLNTFYY